MMKHWSTNNTWFFLRTLPVACDQVLRPPPPPGSSLWMKFCCRRRPLRLRTVSPSPQTKERQSVKEGNLSALNIFHSYRLYGFNVGEDGWQSQSFILLLLCLWQPKNNGTSTVLASAHQGDENPCGERQATESKRLLLHQVLCDERMSHSKKRSLRCYLERPGYQNRELWTLLERTISNGPWKV